MHEVTVLRKIKVPFLSKPLLPNCGSNFLLTRLWAQSGDINHEIRVQGETPTLQ